MRVNVRESMNTYRYYHQKIIKTLRFIVAENKKVLVVGSLDGELLNGLKPSFGVGFETDKNLTKKATKSYPNLKFLNFDFESYKINEKFDFIILNGVLGQSQDLIGLIKSLPRVCHPSTRIIIYQHNHLWQWILSTVERWGWKRKEGIQNWLSVADASVYLSSCGFEVSRIFRSTIFPLYLFGVGPVLNFLASLIPVVDFLKLDQFIIARPLPDLLPKYKLPTSLTVCITVRNERDNIEGIVKALPIICSRQEILFVEGHSIDGTWQEIERVQKKYPTKKVRVIGQPGKGQGDAIRVGFKDAKGDIIILYEGDGTSDPGDLRYFYEAMKEGRFEFIEGSRFVYPLDPAAMPIPNKIGNVIFAKWFSFLLGQRTTDVLSGIKAILKRDYEMVLERWGFLELQDPFGDFELLYGSARMGLRIGEIPMRYYPRVYGISKSHVVKHGMFLIRMALKGYWIFRRN